MTTRASADGAGGDPALLVELLDALEATGAPLAPLCVSDDGRDSLELLDGGSVELLSALYAPVVALDERLSLGDGDAPTRGAGGSKPAEAAVGAVAEAAVEAVAEVAAETSARPRRVKTAAAGGEKSKKAKSKATRRPRLSNPNKAREERRRELLYLRAQAAELERQASALQSTTALLPPSREALGAAAKDSSRLADDAMAPAAAGMAEVWRQMCLRQLDRRIKAERENARLKRAVASQLKVSSAMHKLLQKPASINEATNVVLRTRMAAPPSASADDRELFAQLLAEADAAAGQVDAFLADNGLLGVDAARRGTRMREAGGGRQVLDVFAASVLPFDWEFAGRGVWEFYKGVQKHYGPILGKNAQSVGPRADTVLESFVMEVAASNAVADFRFRQVVKRVAFPRRLVIVWTNDSQPAERAGRAEAFGCFRETGFVVCRPPMSGADAADATDGSPVSVIQVGYRVSPYSPPRAEPMARATMSDIAQFVFTSYDAEICRNLERVEDLLFDEQRRQ